MKSKQIMNFAMMAIIIAVIMFIIFDAAFRARANTLTAFSNYSPQWEDALRLPVEQRAFDVMGQLSSDPQQDPELAMAAINVLRRSPTWSERSPHVYSQLRAVLEIRLSEKPLSLETIRPIYNLLEASEYADIASYRDRIIALAGDRTALIAAVQEAVVQLQMTGEDGVDEALKNLQRSWSALRVPIDDKPLNWLAANTPEIVGIELQARNAVERYIRQVLVTFGIPQDAQYGKSIPDQAMIEWLDNQAQIVNTSRPQLRQRLRASVTMLRMHNAEENMDPVIIMAINLASRHHIVPWSGILIGLLTIIMLSFGIAYAAVRLRRGPTPVDVNAETMENVEPIDLDTDAETRSRSSASITDVG